MADTLYPKPKWLGLSDNYDDLNAKLNGLPDVIRKVNAPAPASADAPSPFFDKLAAVDKGLYGSLPFGIYKLLGKIDPEMMQQFEEGAARNPGYETAGQIAGTVGQALEAPAIGAGKFAGAAGKGLLNILGRNAINAGVSAAPQAITEAAGGDVGQAAKDFAVNTGIGTVGGTALEGILRGAGRLVPAIKKGILNASVADAGIQTKPLRQVVMGAAGDPIARTEKLKEQINALANKTRGTAEDITTDAGKMRTVKKMEADWDTQVDQAFDSFKGKGGKLEDLAPTIYADQRVKDIIDQNPELIDKLDGIINIASKRADTQGIGAARRFVRDRVIDLGRRPGASDDAFLNSQLGEAIHDAIDAKFVPAELKATYARDLLLKKVLLAEDLKVPKVARSGSQTAARLLTHAAMTGAGGIIPGAAAVGIGGIANDIAGDAINRGVGKMATALYPKLGPMTGEGVTDLAQAAGPIMAKLGGEGALSQASQAMEAGPVEDAGALSDAIPAGPEQAPAPAGAVPIPVAPAVPPQAVNTAAPAQPAPQAPAPGPPAPPPPTPQEQGQEQFSQTSPVVPNKIGKWNEDAIKARMEQKYSRYVRKYGTAVSPQEYMQKVLQATDGLNPMNAATWKGMYDDPTQAEKMFKDYLALQKMPLESKTFVTDGLNHYHRLISLGPRIAPEAQLREEQANSIMVQALSDITKQPVKAIDTRLKQIAFDRGKSAVQKKQAVIDMIAKEGGIDWNTFHEMGLI